jgi:hypothetical protein
VSLESGTYVSAELILPSAPWTPAMESLTLPGAPPPTPAAQPGHLLAFPCTRKLLPGRSLGLSSRHLSFGSNICSVERSSLSLI